MVTSFIIEEHQILRIFDCQNLEYRYNKTEGEKIPEFCEKESIPIFKMQTGIVGVQNLIQQEKSLVITYWSRLEGIKLMEITSYISRPYKRSW